MMPTATTRKPQVKRPGSRKPVNARSLQMMVSSGVVRRADYNPTLMQTRRELPLPTGTGKVQPQHASLAQGWLVRLLVRRRSAASL